MKLGKLLKKLLPIGLGVGAAALGAPLIGSLLSGGAGAALGGGEGPANDYTGSYPSGGTGGATDDYESGYQGGHSAGDPGTAVVAAGDPSIPGASGGNLSTADMVRLGGTAASLGMSLPQLLGVLGPAAMGLLNYNATGKATEQTLAGITKAGDDAKGLMGQNQALWAPYAAAGPGGIAGMQSMAGGAANLGSGRWQGGPTLGSMARGR